MTGARPVPLALVSAALAIVEQAGDLIVEQGGVFGGRSPPAHAGALVRIDARNKADAVCMDVTVLDKGGRAVVIERGDAQDVNGHS